MKNVTNWQRKRATGDSGVTEASHAGTATFCHPSPASKCKLNLQTFKRQHAPGSKKRRNRCHRCRSYFSLSRARLNSITRNKQKKESQTQHWKREGKDEKTKKVQCRVAKRKRMACTRHATWKPFASCIDDRTPPRP